MNNIPVFYSPECATVAAQPSPSAKKPALLVDQWLSQNQPIDLVSPTPLKKEDFYTSHDKSHVDAIFNLTKPNGMDTFSQELNDTLYYTSGSLLSAARRVISSPDKIAISPTSGFHHAEYASAMGYCTFNGLMITAQTLLRENLVSKIGILDCDQHYGNGTQNIIDKFNLNSKINHITAEKDYSPYIPFDTDFFNQLPDFLESFVGASLLIYQAGADCHIDDPHGGFLSTEQMSQRDAMVFSFCRLHNIPLVWNLAGGYQETLLPSGQTSIQTVLDLHTNTLEECKKVYLK